MIRSAAANPVPDQLQLGEAGQTAVARLLGPAKPTLTAIPVPDFALTLAGKTLPSAPSCAQVTESLEPWLDWLVTPIMLSDQAAVATHRRIANPHPRLS